jgi:hypothetical protein
VGEATYKKVVASIPRVRSRPHGFAGVGDLDSAQTALMVIDLQVDDPAAVLDSLGRSA